MSEPDLFVVCKNCSSEVSAYVTECPYCGHRLRKRAPRLDRTGTGMPPEEDDPAPKRRLRMPTPPKVGPRPDATPVVPADTRPYAIYTLVGLSLVVTLALSIVGPELLFTLGILGPVDGRWWRLLTSPFVFDNQGYQFVALVGTAVFGTQLEQRYGRVAAIAVFLFCAVAGAALAVGTVDYPALGANGAALGLLAAWWVDDHRAARRGEERESDLIGAYVFAAVLVLLSVAADSASIAAAAGGALVGLVLGFLLSTLRR